MTTDTQSVYIYDFSNDAWSKQVTSGTPAALQNSRSSAILDHDTNVIFTIPGNGAQMYELDMGSVVAKAAGTAAWSDVRTPAFDTANYKVTAALASNHIRESQKPCVKLTPDYFGVPNTPAGSANLFVIHCKHLQKPKLNVRLCIPASSSRVSHCRRRKPIPRFLRTGNQSSLYGKERLWSHTDALCPRGRFQLVHRNSLD